MPPLMSDIMPQPVWPDPGLLIPVARPLILGRVRSLSLLIGPFRSLSLRRLGVLDIVYGV